MLKRTLITISLLVGALLVCAQPTARAQSNNRSTTDSQTASSPRRLDPSEKMAQNGIFVGDPKVYDDRSLQTLLNSLKARLGQLSGLDQSTLITREGSLQGVSASQLGFSMQGSGMPLPSSTTTSSKSGTQTQVTSPTVSPTPPTLPNASSFSQPSTFSQSALNTLGEQMQVSYEIINLQMLLEGSLNDQYVRGTNIRKRHVTLGFPISITVLNKDYEDAVAEVKITACNSPGGYSIEPPSLMTVLPREKTYNVGTYSNKLASLGASAVVAGVVNLGASFLWSHQTYYIVQDQDTIAVQQPSESSRCVTFVWYFRPVLGEKTVRQGLRQTFAQISFPPPPQELSRILGKELKEPEPDIIGMVTVETKWHKYNRKAGIISDELVAGSKVSSHYSWITNFDKSPPNPSIETKDNYDGTTTVTASTHYKSRTRVRIGSLFLDESTPGFQHTPEYIKFTVPNQLLALNGANIVSPSGLETPLDYWWPGVSEKKPAEEVKLAAAGANLVEVIIPKASLEVPPGEWSKEDVQAMLKGKEGVGGPFPLIVTMGGKAFGLGDAPFKSETETYITLLVPKDFIRNQQELIVKRQLLWTEFTHSYKIPELFDVTGLTVLSENRENTVFALSGSGLRGNIKILHPLDPPEIQLSVQDPDRGTMAFLTLPTKQLSGLKQLVLQRGFDPPILVAIPDSKPSEKNTTLSAHDPIEVAKGVTYTIGGPMAESIVAIHYLDKNVEFKTSSDKKSVILKLPDDMTGSPGTRWLDIIYSNKSTERYKVEVINPKAKQP